MVSARRVNSRRSPSAKPRNWCRSCAVCSLTLFTGFTSGRDEAMRGSVTSEETGARGPLLRVLAADVGSVDHRHRWYLGPTDGLELRLGRASRASRRSPPHAGGARSRATLPFACPSASSMRSMSTTRRRDAADEGCAQHEGAEAPLETPHGVSGGLEPTPEGNRRYVDDLAAARPPLRGSHPARGRNPRDARFRREVFDRFEGTRALLSRWTLGEYLSRYRHERTAVVTIPTDATAGDALDLLARRNILSAPVTDADALLVRGVPSLARASSAEPTYTDHRRLTFRSALDPRPTPSLSSSASWTSAISSPRSCTISRRSDRPRPCPTTPPPPPRTPPLARAASPSSSVPVPPPPPSVSSATRAADDGSRA